MTLWGWILLASATAYLTKLSGYLIPAQWLRNERMTRIAGTLTIGLLASLTAVNTLSAGAAIALDARLGALIAAAIALACRLPFLAVVAIGAVAAAVIRFVVSAGA